MKLIGFILVISATFAFTLVCVAVAAQGIIADPKSAFVGMILFSVVCLVLNANEKET